MLADFAASLPKGCALATVTPDHCRAWFDRDELEPISRLGYYNRLHAFFGWCVRRGHLAKSPCDRLERPVTPRRRVPRYLSRPEVRAVKEAIRSDWEERIRAHCPVCVIWMVEVIDLAVHTGLRRGELVYQRWKDVDPDAGFLLVRSYENEYRRFATKWRSERRVPLSGTATAILERLREKQVAAGLLDPESTVLKGPKGGALGPGRVSVTFRKYRRIALPDREEICFHDLRHTFASWMVQAGVDLYVVKEMMGHRSITTTQRYAHLAPEIMRAAVEKAFGSAQGDI